MALPTQKLHARGPMGLPELNLDEVRGHRRRAHARLTRLYPEPRMQ
ncbi:hypothetical protein ACU686_23675 [Yinghuangia aomiensis]